jgi:putative FmdB family regulatory protein
MPIYLYECDSCGIRFEQLQRMSDDPLIDCPECNNGHVHRVIQPVGIIFKGSGFYITDNRQVSSPTLTPPKELDKPKEEGAPSAEETKKDSTGLGEEKRGKQKGKKKGETD